MKPTILIAVITLASCAALRASEPPKGEPTNAAKAAAQGAAKKSKPNAEGEKAQDVSSLLRQLNQVQEDGRWNEAEEILAELLSLEPKLKDDLQATSITILLNRSLEQKKWDAAEKHLDELIQIEPQAQTALLAVRIQILTAKGDMKQVGVLARKALNDEKDRCRLHAIAQALLDPAGGSQREIIVLAHELALAANKGDLVGDCRAGHLSVLAHAEFLLGRKAKAVEIADKALRVTDDPEMKKRIQLSLDSYKSGKLPTSTK